MTDIPSVGLSRHHAPPGMRDRIAPGYASEFAAIAPAGKVGPCPAHADDIRMTA